MNSRVLLFIVGSALGLSSCQGQGAFVASHYGSTDPTSEGFTLLRAGNPSLAQVTDDSGRDAWFIGLASASDIAQYTQVLTAQEETRLGNGWTLSVSLRILAPFFLPLNGIMAGVHTGTESFLLHFGAQPNGDPVVLCGISSYVLNGGGSAYHDYELQYDSQSGTAGLWIDGIERLKGLAGSSSPLSARLIWGGIQHPPGVAYANWNEVSWSVVPEPSMLPLWVVGGSLLWAGRCRRLRRRSQPNETCQTMD